MGFHMLGFHVVTTILGFFGIEFEHHFTTPEIGHNVFLLIGYLSFGIGIPLMIRFICYNKIYCFICKKV